MVAQVNPGAGYEAGGIVDARCTLRQSRQHGVCGWSNGTKRQDAPMRRQRMQALWSWRTAAEPCWSVMQGEAARRRCTKREDLENRTGPGSVQAKSQGGANATLSVINERPVNATQKGVEEHAGKGNQPIQQLSRVLVSVPCTRARHGQTTACAAAAEAAQAQEGNKNGHNKTATQREAGGCTGGKADKKHNCVGSVVALCAPTQHQVSSPATHWIQGGLGRTHRGEGLDQGHQRGGFNRV